MMNLTETKVETIKKYIKEQNFQQYVDGITDQPSTLLIEEFSECFDDIEFGVPLLALEATYKFLLTTNYLLWWDDAVEYNYEPIDNVLIYEDCMFATVAVSKKKEDTYMGNIVDGDDLDEGKRDAFAEAMQSLIEFILRLKR